MMRNRIINSLTVATMILLSGCASYKAQSLSLLPPESGITATKDTNATLSWKDFSTEDCKRYLGRDLLSEGYRAVQVTIRNNSNDPLYFNPAHFNVPLANSKEVAISAHTSTGGRIAAWGVGGLLFFPLFIPAVVDGFKSSEANDQLDSDYEAKSLKEHTIQPHSYLNGVVFIPKNAVRERLGFFVVNLNTNEKIYFPEISLSQR